MRLHSVKSCNSIEVAIFSKIHHVAWDEVVLLVRLRSRIASSLGFFSFTWIMFPILFPLLSPNIKLVRSLIEADVSSTTIWASNSIASLTFFARDRVITLSPQSTSPCHCYFSYHGFHHNGNFAAIDKCTIAYLKLVMDLSYASRISS